MKQAMQTLKRCFRSKQGRLLFGGMVLGLLAALVGSSFGLPQKQATLITMVGAIVSLTCGNGFARMIAIYQQTDQSAQ